MSSSQRQRGLSKRITRRGIQGGPKKVLIVTEGRKTEKEYFGAMIRRLDIGSDVDILANCDPAPTSVVQSAKDKINENNNYHRVFCVIDRDNHGDYDKALKEIEEANRHGDTAIDAIPSLPCFEYWLYLHKEYSSKPYPAHGTPAKEMIDDLRKLDIFKDYDKSISDSLFSILYDNCKDAIKRANRALKESHSSDPEIKIYHENPSTRVHRLVENLESIVRDRVE